MQIERRDIETTEIEESDHMEDCGPLLFYWVNRAYKARS
jgi:hypothetical protein